MDESGVADQPHDVQFPQLDLPVAYSSGSIGFSFSESNPNSDVVQPGSLADYMGFPVGFVPTYPEGKNKISAQKVLCYLDVIYHYYINQQVPNIPTALWVPRSGSKEEFNYEYSVASIYSLLMAVKTSRDPSNALWQYVNSNMAQFKNYTIGSWSWLCSRASIFSVVFLRIISKVGWLLPVMRIRKSRSISTPMASRFPSVTFLRCRTSSVGWIWPSVVVPATRTTKIRSLTS